MAQATPYFATAEVLDQPVGLKLATEDVAPPLSAANQRPSAPRPGREQRPFNYRQLFWKWHLYAGLFGAPLMILIALTGAILVFGPEIDRLIRPELWHI